MKAVLHYGASPGFRASLAGLADGLDIVVVDEESPDFAREIADAEILLHVLKPVTRAMIEGARQLRLIQKIGVGVNTIDLDAARSRGVAVANIGETIAEDGYAVNGFASRPGLRWKLIGIRSSQGVPVYEPDMQNGTGGNLYGYPLSEVDNGGWDASKAQLIAGDWSKAIVGLRQDITFKMFTEGVISDDSGAVVLNLMQQDSVAMRVTMRMAFATANPVTKLNATGATRYPFGVIETGTGTGSA